MTGYVVQIEKQTQAQMDERREKIVMLEERIKAMQQRIEVCGEEGEIDEAKDLTNQVEQLSSQLNHMKQVRPVVPDFIPDFSKMFRLHKKSAEMTCVTFVVLRLLPMRRRNVKKPIWPENSMLDTH